MSDLINSVNEYFKNTPQEQIKKDWSDIKAMNLGGPTVEQYFKSTTPHWFIGYDDSNGCKTCGGNIGSYFHLIIKLDDQPFVVQPDDRVKYVKV